MHIYASMWQGFKLGHTVIDRKTLSHTAFKLVSGFTTVYAFLVAMTEENSVFPSHDGNTCELGREQVHMIELVLGQNKTSCLNLTVAAMLGRNGA